LNSFKLDKAHQLQDAANVENFHELIVAAMNQTLERLGLMPSVILPSRSTIRLLKIELQQIAGQHTVPLR
jgi:hypothetical protein